MRTKAILLVTTIVLLTTHAVAQTEGRRWLPVQGNLAGPKFYVTSVVDADTEMAMARGRVDREAAREWCAGDAKGDDCIEKVLADNKAKEVRATADCTAGSLYATDVRQYEIGTPEGQSIRWMDANGIAVDPSSDWGQSLTRQWNVLCPSGRPVKRPRSQVAAAPHPAPSLMVEGTAPGRNATQNQIEAAETAPVRPAGIPATAASRDGIVPPSELNGSVYGHNGSMMRIDVHQGIIVYEEPKASLANVAEPGTVLFRGRIGTPGMGQKIAGTAYAFKSGCAPAAYPVTGRYSADNSEIVLTGAGPTWSGCSYSLTNRSKHSTLRFRSMISP